MSDSAKPYYSLKNTARILDIERDELEKIAENISLHYDPYDIDQIKPDGKVKTRHIDNPSKKLKNIQRRILKRILLEHVLLLPEGMIGGVPKKSIKDNALPHVGKEVVATIDIRNCFPSTKNSMIFKVWRNHIECGTKVARLLTQLTTFRRLLPQGSPTSSALCNLYLLPLYIKIKTYSDQNDISLSFYVDDITLSGEKEVVLPAINVIIKAIQKHGYAVKRKKVKIMRANRPQITTGLSTNSKVGIPNRKIEDVRHRIILLAKKEKEITMQEYRSIKGNILHIKNISKEKGIKLERLADCLLSEPNLDTKFTEKSRIKRKCRHHKNERVFYV